MSKTYISILAAQALTATGSGDAVDVRQASGVSYFVLSADAASAGASAVVIIEHSENGTTGWSAAGVAFDPVTDASATTQAIMANIDQLRPFVRATVTIDGEDASVACSVVLATRQNYA